MARTSDPSEPQLTLPKKLRWDIITGAVFGLIFVTWYSSGINAEVRSNSRAYELLAIETRELAARLTKVENEFAAQKAMIQYLVEASYRQERRSGYTPPKPPNAAINEP